MNGVITMFNLNVAIYFTIKNHVQKINDENYMFYYSEYRGIIKDVLQNVLKELL